MVMRRLLPGVLLLAVAAPTLALIGPASGPSTGNLTCTPVHGSHAFTSVSSTSIDGTLAGDLTGTFALGVTASSGHGGMLVSVTHHAFSGTVAETNGNLNVNGHYRAVAFNLPITTPGGMPLPPLPIPQSFSFSGIRMHITGGDGAYVDATGVIFGRAFSNGTMNQSQYRGVVCVPAAPPPLPLAATR